MEEGQEEIKGKEGGGGGGGFDSEGSLGNGVNSPGSDSRCKIALWWPSGERAGRWDRSTLASTLWFSQPVTKSVAA